MYPDGAQKYINIARFFNEDILYLRGNVIVCSPNTEAALLLRRNANKI